LGSGKVKKGPTEMRKEGVKRVKAVLCDLDIEEKKNNGGGGKRDLEREPPTFRVGVTSSVEKKRS